ncbi:CidA/LrgA family protein [Alteromonas sp. CYL-A6]|uniref:CidA/LrgA family protein n=1 Tax=Alteromonas nitratireducens TaxID=3390813 RepID=UPI0034BF28AF
MSTLRHYVMGWAGILGCFFFGNAVVAVTHIPLPPALIGLMTLLVFLIVRGRPAEAVALAGAPLLKHMSLLFVPAVLGVTLYWSDIQAHALALFVSIVITTIISLAITAISADKILRAKPEKPQ